MIYQINHDLYRMTLIPKELTELLHYSHSLAKFLLTEQGEFYPFGVYLNNANVVTQRMFNDGDDFPLSTGLISIIKYDFDSLLASESIAASAITYEGRVTNSNYNEPIDTIIVRLKLRSLESALLHYLPYQILDDKYEYLQSWTEVE